MISSILDWQEQKDLDLLTQLAIDAALNSDWQQAEKINQKILSMSSKNVEALNRLARAQTCAGEIDKAQKTYKKVLDIDPYNIIAKKNVEKLSKVTARGTTTKSNSHYALKNSTNGQANTITNLSSVFLFEPGKTKVISLLNLASPSILGLLNCGDKVEILSKKHSVCITNTDGTYLGALPDDISHKIIFYISGGNKYEAYVKLATPKTLAIFLREVERSAKFTNQPSFQDSNQYFEDKEALV